MVAPNWRLATPWVEMRGVVEASWGTKGGGMLACVDVHYGAEDAVAACLVFEGWERGEAAQGHVKRVEGIAEYVPGEFYRRELPCVLAVLGEVQGALDVVVVDGYVWLGQGRRGLGAYLHEALGGEVAVVGVAKSAFAGNDQAVPVTRGGSERALYVTAAGVDVDQAARWVRSMHGEHRIPTLLKAVDHLCRGIGD